MDQTALQKFSQLPAEIKNTLSGPEFLGVIEALEEKYQSKLVIFFISLVVGDLMLADLEKELKLILPPEAVSETMAKFSAMISALKNKFPGQLAIAGDLPDNRASFSFSTEDEAEVDKFKAIFSSSSKISNYEQIADSILLESGLSQSDEIMMSRLRGIVVARLREVRDDLETIDALKKSRKIGGMEFSSEQIDKILKLIKSRLSNKPTDTPEAKSIIFPVSKPIKMSDASGPLSLKEKIKKSGIDYRQMFNFRKAESQNVPIAEKKEEKPAISQTSHNIQKPSGLLVKAGMPVIKEEGGLPVIKMPDDIMIKPKRMDFEARLKQEPTAVMSPTFKNNQSPIKPFPQPAKNVMPPKSLGAQQSRKPKLDDIRFTKKLIGPIEELAYMTLIDFRRLAENPTLATKKIKDKIDLLEKESFAKKIEGIDAWHKCEVNKFYRLLGQKSMTDGVSIENIINERLQTGKPTLSVDEFNVVMELNRQLRF